MSLAVREGSYFSGGVHALHSQDPIVNPWHLQVELHNRDMPVSGDNIKMVHWSDSG